MKKIFALALFFASSALFAMEEAYLRQNNEFIAHARTLTPEELTKQIFDRFSVLHELVRKQTHAPAKQRSELIMVEKKFRDFGLQIRQGHTPRIEEYEALDNLLPIKIIYDEDGSMHLVPRDPWDQQEIVRAWSR